jgi:hypothetical protein
MYVFDIVLMLIVLVVCLFWYVGQIVPNPTDQESEGFRMMDMHIEDQEGH